MVNQDSVPFVWSSFELNFLKKILESDNNISKNFSGPVVGSGGSVQCHIFPYSSLYLLSSSIDPLPMHSQC